MKIINQMGPKPFTEKMKTLGSKHISTTTQFKVMLEGYIKRNEYIPRALVEVIMKNDLQYMVDNYPELIIRNMG